MKGDRLIEAVRTHRMTRFIASKDRLADAALYEAARAVAWKGQSVIEAAEGAMLREALRRYGRQLDAAAALGISTRVMSYRLGIWGMQDKQLKPDA